MAQWLHVLQLAQGQACPARQREGKAWLQPELAGGQAGGWMGGPGSMLPIGCLQLPPRLTPEPVAPRPAPASPAASKLPEQAPPAGPCRAATGSEWPLPWTCLRSSSPCWSTLYLGQRRGQVGTEVACIGWPPKCPRGSRHPQAGLGRTGISSLGRVPSRGLSLVPSWARGRAGVQKDMVGSATATQELPLGLLAGGSRGQRVATDRCCAHMGQEQDQRALLREYTECNC